MLVLKAPRALPRFVVAGMTAVLLTGSAAVAQHFPAFQQAVAEGVSGQFWPVGVLPRHRV